MIPFNIPCITGDEPALLERCLASLKLAGDGGFTKECSALMEELLGAARVLLTTSGTHALEMAALLLDLRLGDEVIMPSFTFVSTANAFVLRGAKIVFVDVRPDTMNLDERLVEDAVTDRTRAIVPVHYGGVACEMDALMDIADRRGLRVIEDAAQGIDASYHGRPLGAIGDLGCFSFHETKNITCGEGGALICRDAEFVERAEFLREKGTNRSKFFRGQIDKYTWVDVGSSYLPGELCAAYLCAQLRRVHEITARRVAIFDRYHAALADLEQRGRIERPAVPDGCTPNGHLYYIKLADLDERTRFIAHLKEQGVGAVFHYIPLHSSPYGKTCSRFHGEDRHTTRESERLVRLPFFHALSDSQIDEVVDGIYSFF